MFGYISIPMGAVLLPLVESKDPVTFHTCVQVNICRLPGKTSQKNIWGNVLSLLCITIVTALLSPWCGLLLDAPAYIKLLIYIMYDHKTVGSFCEGP